MQLTTQNRAVIRLQWITVAWMTVEFAVAVGSGLRAHSLALAAFGGDSAIELFSAAVVLHRFYSGDHMEQLARRMAMIMLYALAVFIALSSGASLALKMSEAKGSYLGIGILLAAAIIMPWLGLRKRELSAQTCSKALRADAVQSSVCAYMSWIALAGIALNTVFHLPWIDSVAALALVPLILIEANKARKGDDCC
ncbi:cation transporter [Alloacidobacterium dinghuense]|uniref:Cation transporter n=1 Tax=Alloacidobacterium dinghuense TaxID=2763107 RepID=A0A7G8BEM7_9BACT|nr:cation transporter [Alloacidobacterium dinghuense]QNI30997.1 cation transporter [Alloacidobacterium dinghuense]